MYLCIGVYYWGKGISSIRQAPLNLPSLLLSLLHRRPPYICMYVHILVRSPHWGDTDGGGGGGGVEDHPAIVLNVHSRLLYTTHVHNCILCDKRKQESIIMTTIYMTLLRFRYLYKLFSPHLPSITTPYNNIARCRWWWSWWSKVARTNPNKLAQFIWFACLANDNGFPKRNRANQGETPSLGTLNNNGTNLWISSELVSELWVSSALRSSLACTRWTMDENTVCLCLSSAILTIGSDRRHCVDLYNSIHQPEGDELQFKMIITIVFCCCCTPLESPSHHILHSIVSWWSFISSLVVICM